MIFASKMYVSDSETMTIKKFTNFLAVRNRKRVSLRKNEMM